MDKEKGEPVVVVKEDETKEAKEGAPAVRAKSTTSTHSKDKADNKKEEKKDLLSFDKIKVRRRKTCSRWIRSR
jgi:hypothetical protein